MFALYRKNMMRLFICILKLPLHFFFFSKLPKRLIPSTVPSENHEFSKFIFIWNVKDCHALSFHFNCYIAFISLILSKSARGILNIILIRLCYKVARKIPRCFFSEEQSSSKPAGTSMFHKEALYCFLPCGHLFIGIIWRCIIFWLIFAYLCNNGKVALFFRIFKFLHCLCLIVKYRNFILVHNHTIAIQLEHFHVSNKESIKGCLIAPRPKAFIGFNFWKNGVYFKINSLFSNLKILPADYPIAILFKMGIYNSVLSFNQVKGFNCNKIHHVSHYYTSISIS